MSGRRRWRCRPIRAGDEAAIVGIFERAFGRSTSVEEWRWKLATHDYDPTNVWVAVDQDDRPVSHYGGVPRRLCVGGREYRAMVVADAMTAPEVQRQGAFTRLARSAHTAWREAGVSLVLGMPNERHGSTMEAIGWHRVTSLRWAIRPLRPSSLLRRRLRMGRLPGGELVDRGWNAWHDRDNANRSITVESVDAAAGRVAFAVVDRMVSDTGRLALLRDPEWLTHRLLHGPGGSHEILVAADARGPVGLCAYRTRRVGGRLIGSVTELAAGSDEAIDGLARAAAVRLRRAGAETALTLVVSGSREHEVVRRRGFRFSWGGFGVHAVLLDPGLAAGELRDADWMLTGGDFDVL